MLKTAAIIFGIVFLLVGVLGFVPGSTTGEMPLGIFHVNAVHNIVHVLSGAVALISGLMSTAAARMYFRVFGIVYALVAILGFLIGNGLLLGLISNNMADTWLHVVIALVALALGFVV
jgi:hypothetical protein